MFSFVEAGTASPKVGWLGAIGWRMYRGGRVRELSDWLQPHQSHRDLRREQSVMTELHQGSSRDFQVEITNVAFVTSVLILLLILPFRHLPRLQMSVLSSRLEGARCFGSGRAVPGHRLTRHVTVVSDVTPCDVPSSLSLIGLQENLDFCCKYM